MTGWFNNRARGSAVTVEYGARPSRQQMASAPPRLLRLFGARR